MSTSLNFSHISLFNLHKHDKAREAVSYPGSLMRSGKVREPERGHAAGKWGRRDPSPGSQLQKCAPKLHSEIWD